MAMTVNRFLGALKTSQLIALYNYANPTKMVNKFPDHAAAVKRVALLVDSNEYKALYDKFAKRVHGVVFPAPEDMTLVEEEPPKHIPLPPKIPKEKKKQIVKPHINLRCPKCNYYVKTTEDMLAIARPRCPVDITHGLLLTAVERGEKRGR